jgi:hypothetical protein
LRREWPEASGSLARLFTTGYPLPGTAQPHNYRYPWEPWKLFMADCGPMFSLLDYTKDKMMVGNSSV